MKFVMRKNGQKMADVRVSGVVGKFELEVATMDLIYFGEKPTRKTIENRVKDSIFYSGIHWFENWEDNNVSDGVVIVDEKEVSIENLRAQAIAIVEKKFKL